MINLNEIGVYSERIPKNIFENIKSLVNTASEDHNNELVGQIEKELKINLNQHKDISEYLLKIVTKTNLFQEYMVDLMKQNNKNFLNLKLVSSWINFQKENEFNPLHTHDGIFSYIIFIKIPYSYEEQKKLFPKTRPTDIRCGTTCFLTANRSARGGIVENFLPLDFSYEGTIYFFKADKFHLVYPFYNTKEERITMSGNIDLNYDS
jgi:hypothetical protein